MMDLTRRWPFGLNRRNWPDAAAAVVLVLFVLVFFDAWISQSVQAWPQVWRAPFELITDIGLSDWILLPALLVMLLALLAGRLLRAGPSRRAAFELALLAGFVFLAVGVPGIVANLLKRLFGRARPSEFLEGGAFQFQHLLNDWVYQSFPSGHATTALASALVVGFLAPRFFRLILLIAVMTGVSRIVIGVHYPTDVVAGFVLGAWGAYAVRNAFAARRWLFAPRGDGTIRFRGLPNLRRAWRRRFQRAAA